MSSAARADEALLADEALALLADDGPVARRLPGYRLRPSQLDMAAQVAEAIETPHTRLVVEAGTGTGKSLAYLGPALLSDARVVVATGTKALQDQLYEKDLPLLLDAVHELTGRKKQACVMKGRANYLCLTRFASFHERPLFAFHDEAKLYKDIVKWAERTETGDRAEIQGLPDNYATWSDLDASSEHCTGGNCPRYADCFVTKMRRRADESDLVVVNHHLLCADQRIRLEGLPERAEAPDEGEGEDDADDGSDGDEAEARTEDPADARTFGQVIPPWDALIVDEAHALPDVATRYFGVAFGSGPLERVAQDARRIGKEAKKDEKRGIEKATAALEDALDDLGDSLEPFLSGRDRPRLDARTRSAAMQRTGRAAAKALDQLADTLLDVADREGPLSAEGNQARATRKRALGLAEEIAFVLGPGCDDPRFVTWADSRKRGFSLTSAPVDVATALSRTLFRGHRPVVLTSATLAVAGDTRPFEDRVGLKEPSDDESDDDEHRWRSVLPSPFAFERCAALYAPTGMPEPDHKTFADRFDEEVRFLVDLAKGGALLLFTSYAAMEGALARLGDEMEEDGLEVMLQGEAPRPALLERMRKIDNGVLFATQSFWEGVDLRGRALRLVVIDRLPFKSPADPLNRARLDLAEQRGLRPFLDVTLPEAALGLKQGVGRLIRDERDAGVVAILDGRLRTKRYGSTFVRTLPPLCRVGSQKVLREFWRRQVAPTLDVIPASTVVQTSSP